MSVLAASHIAIGVTDMDRALTFYRDVLGLRVDADWRQQLEPSELVGDKPIDRRCVWLRWGDGPYQTAINLDEFTSPDPVDRRSKLFELGIHHVALWVDDVDAIINRARSRGFEVMFPHHAPTETYGEAPGGQIQSVFLKDADGNIVQCDCRA